MHIEINSIVGRISNDGYTQFLATGVICRSESIRTNISTRMKITEITTTMLHDLDGYVIQDATIPAIDPKARVKS
jgi:hypothetical protein